MTVRWKWSSHVNSIVKRATSRINVLRRFKPYVANDFLVQIYNGCIRSILEYCAPIFVNLNAGLSSSIERVQSRCHRVICGPHCECEKFIPLDYRRMILGFKQFLCAVNDENHLLHHLVPPVMTRSQKYKLPLSQTVACSKTFMTSMAKLSNSGFSLK